MSLSPAVELSLVIPAYNEANRIHPTLDCALSYLRRRKQAFEVLVVDDGSRDATAASVEARREGDVSVIRHERNAGKGAAVRLGVARSRGDHVLMMDADLAIPIEELSLLERLVENEYDIACGSRGLPDSRKVNPQPLYRESMGLAFNGILRLLGLTDLRDTQCGFKLFRGAVAREVFSRCRINGFAFDVESLLVARELGYRTAEVAVTWRHVPESRVHPLRDAPRMLIDVLWLRLASWRGHYAVPAQSESRG